MILNILLCTLCGALVVSAAQQQRPIFPGGPAQGNHSPPTVHTTRGSISGYVLPLTDGQKINMFRNIPYAQAPIGQLRWQPPRPAQQWSGVRDGTQPSPMCMQKNDEMGNQLIVDRFPVRPPPTTTAAPGPPTQPPFFTQPTPNPFVTPLPPFRTTQNPFGGPSTFQTLPPLPPVTPSSIPFFPSVTPSRSPFFPTQRNPGSPQGQMRMFDNVDANKQMKTGRKRPEMTEDCLYLNVITPNISSTAKLPVLFMLHGGSFVIGSSDSFNIKGVASNLASRGVVVVMANYRLGIFGFGVTRDGVMQGNYGIQDQIAALQWVRSDIANFGGDPQAVTLYGFSAGAISASLLTIEPQAQGLFRYVSLASGSAYMKESTDPAGQTSIATVEKIAEQLGCPLNGAALVQCLQGRSGRDILAVEPPDTFISLYRPVVADKERRLLNRQPYPTMAGIVSNEAAFLYESDIYSDPRNVAEYYKFNKTYMTQAIPDLLAALYGPDPPTVMIDSLRSVYETGVDNVRDNNAWFWLDRVLKMTSEAIFDAPIYREVSDVASKNGKAYLYIFDYSTPQYKCKQFWRGVSHGDDQVYLTQLFDTETRPVTPSVTDQRVAGLYGELLTNFVKRGDPTPPRMSKYRWEAVRVGENNTPAANYFSIGLRPQMKEEFSARARTVWTNVMPKMMAYANKAQLGDGIPALGANPQPQPQGRSVDGTAVVLPAPQPAVDPNDPLSGMTRF